MAQTTMNLGNITKPAPKWYRKLKRVILVALLPAAIITIKGLWSGSEAELNKVLVIITVALPAALEAVGMLLANGEQYSETENPSL